MIYTKQSVASTGFTFGEAQLAFCIIALLEFLIQAAHGI
jgi:hypothetical protein